MFMGAHGIGAVGVLEIDNLVVQAEEKLIDQAEELIVLVDSSKFDIRTSLVLCPLTRISTLITDTGLSSKARDMVQEAGIKLVTVDAPKDLA